LLAFSAFRLQSAFGTFHSSLCYTTMTQLISKPITRVLSILYALLGCFHEFVASSLPNKIRMFTDSLLSILPVFYKTAFRLFLFLLPILMGSGEKSDSSALFTFILSCCSILCASYVFMLIENGEVIDCLFFPLWGCVDKCLICPYAMHETVCQFCNVTVGIVSMIVVAIGLICISRSDNVDLEKLSEGLFMFFFGPRVCLLIARFFFAHPLLEFGYSLCMGNHALAAILHSFSVWREDPIDILVRQCHEKS